MSAQKLSSRRILILATDGFEQSELEVPKQKLAALGATVDVASPKSGAIKGWNHTDWGDDVKVDVTLEQAKAEDLQLAKGRTGHDMPRGPDVTQVVPAEVLDAGALECPLPRLGVHAFRADD